MKHSRSQKKNCGDFYVTSTVSSRITEDLEEQSNVKKVVLAHYVTLVEIFKHYASVGSAMATGDLDIMEARVSVKIWGAGTRRGCCTFHILFRTMYIFMNSVCFGVPWVSFVFFWECF